MGKLGYQAGGGKVTAENLTAENVRMGTVVTVKQGSKTIKTVEGGLPYGGILCHTLGYKRSDDNWATPPTLCGYGIMKPGSEPASFQFTVACTCRIAISVGSSYAGDYGWQNVNWALYKNGQKVTDLPRTKSLYPCTVSFKEIEVTVVPSDVFTFKGMRNNDYWGCPAFTVIAY